MRFAALVQMQDQIQENFEKLYIFIMVDINKPLHGILVIEFPFLGNI